MLAGTREGYRVTELPVKQFTVEEYHRLIDQGFLNSDDRCEFVRGLIVEKPQMNPAHVTALRSLREWMAEAIGNLFMIDTQAPITLSDSEPQADLILASGSKKDYRHRHPGPADLALVVEVSDSSLTTDRTSMLELYASENIVQYWIVNVKDRQIEIYTSPRSGKRPAYRTKKIYRLGQLVPVILDGETIGMLAVNDILP